MKVDISLNKYIVEPIEPLHAKALCTEITALLPEYFGLPEVNTQYFEGMLSRLSLVARCKDEVVGLITLEFPYPNNANIYWMGVRPEHHRQGIGKILINAANNILLKKAATSLTVETLSPSVADVNYLKTYRFYEECGFQPLFDIKPDGYEFTMVYMYKPVIAKNLKEMNIN